MAAKPMPSKELRQRFRDLQTARAEKNSTLYSNKTHQKEKSEKFKECALPGNQGIEDFERYENAGVNRDGILDRQASSIGIAG
jgi:hypothetical protein